MSDRASKVKREFFQTVEFKLFSLKSFFENYKEKTDKNQRNCGEIFRI